MMNNIPSPITSPHFNPAATEVQLPDEETGLRLRRTPVEPVPYRGCGIPRVLAGELLAQALGVPAKQISTEAAIAVSAAATEWLRRLCMKTQDIFGGTVSLHNAETLDLALTILAEEDCYIARIVRQMLEEKE